MAFDKVVTRGSWRHDAATKFRHLLIAITLVLLIALSFVVISWPNNTVIRSWTLSGPSQSQISIL